MKIVIIGTGNAATILGRKFLQAGHSILQVVGRKAVETKKLADEWKTSSTNNWQEINGNADVYIIAISDHAIEEIVLQLSLEGKIVAHTAASVSKEVLSPVTAHYGIFYPLQSLRKEMTELPEIPVLFDGSDEQTKNILKELARSVSGDKVKKAGDEDRQKIHVAAVIVNNFTNHLFAVAEEYCKKENLDFKLLLPLIKETASRIKDVSPSNAQTGPAIRHDEETIKKHMAILESHPEIKKLYLFLSESIVAKNQKGDKQ